MALHQTFTKEPSACRNLISAVYRSRQTQVGHQKTPEWGIDTNSTVTTESTCCDLFVDRSNHRFKNKMEVVMKKNLFACAFVILTGLLSASSVLADDILIKFNGGIGAIPISNVAVNATTGAVTVNRNVVRGVNSPGQIWRIADLDATIKTNGDISVAGNGLVLAGGDNIGRATGQSVFATLICEATAPVTEHSTTLTGIQLAPNGDFKIDD